MTNGTNTPWTPERAATAKRLWKEGKSATEIARALGGVTRNAVIGKITRAGLQRQRITSKMKREARGAARASAAAQTLAKAPHAARPVAPAKPLPANGTAPETARPWEARQLGQCAWPYDVGGHTFSCCRPVGHESPNWQYCSDHSPWQGAATTAPKPKLERRAGGFNFQNYDQGSKAGWAA
jgi:hypothetical protein